MSEVPPSPENQRFASASGPVNRRTATASPKKPVVHRAVRQRLARTAAQQALGGPLAQQLAQSTPPSSDKAGLSLVVGVGTTLSIAAAILAGVQASLPWAATSALGAVVAGASALLKRRRKTVAPVAAFDRPTLVALDAALAEIAPEVSDTTLTHLLAIKATLVRMAPLMTKATGSEHFTQDDRFYVTELVRRYLPDSLSAYLSVPVAQRDVAGADGVGSACELLDSQLTLLQDELSRRESLLVLGTHAALQQQQRFLQAKHKL